MAEPVPAEKEQKQNSASRCCAFPGCPVKNTDEFRDVRLFQVPKRTDEFYTTWRKKFVDVLTLYRDLDIQRKNDILACKVTVWICENHFHPNDIELTKSGQKTLKLNALPTTNFPKKSHNPETTIERREIVRHELVTHKPKQYLYENFDELTKRVSLLQLKEWRVTMSQDNIVFEKFLPPCIVPHTKIFVDESLEFTIIIFGWPLPDDHNLYKNYYRSVRNVTISDLIKNIMSLNLCPGVGIKSEGLISHVVPCEVDMQDENWHENPFPTRGYERSKDCCVMLKEKDLCFTCKKVNTKFQIAENKDKAKVITPANIKAPLSKTNPGRIILSLKEQREENKQLQKKIKMLEEEIKLNSVPIDNDLHNDIQQIMSEHSNSITPFMQLFWEQQQKLFRKGTGVRYHPMIIRFCMSLASKSASAYDELRSSNILTLPSRRTLRDYKNAIKPGAGFNPDVIQNLIKVAGPLEEFHRYIVLSFDEMKIKKNLVMTSILEI